MNAQISCYVVGNRMTLYPFKVNQ